MAIFKGSCHCGAVKFEIHNQTELQDLMRCNCSLCQRKGIVMATAKLEDLVITEGEDKLTLYQWNTKIAKHFFCSVCGIYTHHQRRRRPDEFGVNAACIEGLDISKLTDIKMTDGRDLSVVSET